MTRIVTTYEPVRQTGVKSLPCPVCGRKYRRQRTFQQTISPFNRNPDGTPKNRAEVAAAVKVQIVAWQGEPETHPACVEGGK